MIFDDQNSALDAHRAWCDTKTNAYVYLKLKSEFWCGNEFLID